jgi:excisionase family DNA binding protein
MVRSARQESFLKPDELAEILGLDVEEVYGLLEARKLPGIRLGQAWRIRERDFIRFIDDQSQENSYEWKGNARQSSVPRGGEVRFLLFGRERSGQSWADMLVQVIEEFVARDPGFLLKFGQAGGRKRRYVAQDREDLYDSRPDLAKRFSRQLSNGWWLGTNYSRKDIFGMLEKACAIAGYRFGTDLDLAPPVKIDIEKALAFIGIAADPDSDASTRHNELFARGIADELG